MEYNFQEKVYELSVLLKQGYYNYQFVFLNTKDQSIDSGLIEGNFDETENNYIIYVYYRRPGTRYDRLLGFEKINVFGR